MLLATSYTLPLARALFAALLTLALLSGIVPVAALSSSHSCDMPCCAGAEGGCATGACQGALFKSPKKEEEEEKLCGSEAAFKSHAAAKRPQKSVPAGASVDEDHCGSEHEKGAKAGDFGTAARSLEAYGDEGAGGSFSAPAVTAPCARDCCAAASPSTQSRRGRDTALSSFSGKLQPPEFLSLSLYLLNLQPISSAHLKRLKARAPPRTSSYSKA